MRMMRKGILMTNFEQILDSYQPMISSIIRRLHIYRDFEQFRQVGAIALWQAWQRYDAEKGDFAPFAYRSMYGAMLDELKKETRQTTKIVPECDEALHQIPQGEKDSFDWSEPFEYALTALTKEEKQLLHWLFVERLTYVQCANKLGMTKDGVTKKRQRILAKLRQQPHLASYIRHSFDSPKKDRYNNRQKERN